MVRAAAEGAEVKRAGFTVAVFQQPIREASDGGGRLIYTIDRDFFRGEIDRAEAVESDAIHVRLMPIVLHGTDGGLSVGEECSVVTVVWRDEIIELFTICDRPVAHVIDALAVGWGLVDKQIDRCIHAAAGASGDEHVSTSVIADRVIPAERRVIQAVRSKHLIGRCAFRSIVANELAPDGEIGGGAVDESGDGRELERGHAFEVPHVAGGGSAAHIALDHGEAVGEVTGVESFLGVIKLLKADRMVIKPVCVICDERPLRTVEHLVEVVGRARIDLVIDGEGGLKHPELRENERKRGGAVVTGRSAARLGFCDGIHFTSMLARGESVGKTAFTGGAP